MYDKQNIDKEAEQEGLALQKQGRYKQTKWYYIREQTSDYNTERFRKQLRRK